MLVDTNLLVYAVHRENPAHDRALHWLMLQLAGVKRVALPWQSLTSFVRIVTHPRIFERPMDGPQAMRIVRGWVDNPTTWMPEPGPGHAAILGDLLERHQVTADLVPDAQLAALAIEHGLTVCSADSDFARFTEVRWENPLAV